jgi:ketosteroid isomerase-like protein
MRFNRPIWTIALVRIQRFDHESIMRILTSTFTLLSFLFMQSPARAADRLSPAERQEFKALAYKLWTGWDSLDPAKVASFYSKDPNNVYFDITPLKFTGWQEYATEAGKNLQGAGGAKWSPNGEDFKVIRSGDLAVTTLTMNVLFTNKSGVTTKMQVRDTDVWEKQGGKWLIVHEHVSVPSGGAALEASQSKSK